MKLRLSGRHKVPIVWGETIPRCNRIAPSPGRTRARKVSDLHPSSSGNQHLIPPWLHLRNLVQELFLTSSILGEPCLPSVPYGWAVGTICSFPPVSWESPAFAVYPMAGRWEPFVPYLHYLGRALPSQCTLWVGGGNHLFLTSTILGEPCLPNVPYGWEVGTICSLSSVSMESPAFPVYPMAGKREPFVPYLHYLGRALPSQCTLWVGGGNHLFLIFSILGEPCLPSVPYGWEMGTICSSPSLSWESPAFPVYPMGGRWEPFVPYLQYLGRALPSQCTLWLGGGNHLFLTSTILGEPCLPNVPYGWEVGTICSLPPLSWESPAFPVYPMVGGGNHLFLTSTILGEPCLPTVPYGWEVGTICSLSPLSWESPAFPVYPMAGRWEPFVPHLHYLGRALPSQCTLWVGGGNHLFLIFSILGEPCLPSVPYGWAVGTICSLPPLSWESPAFPMYPMAGRWEPFVPYLHYLGRALPSQCTLLVGGGNHLFLTSTILGEPCLPTVPYGWEVGTICSLSPVSWESPAFPVYPIW